jgi:hypothetical protein
MSLLLPQDFYDNWLSNKYLEFYFYFSLKKLFTNKKHFILLYEKTVYDGKYNKKYILKFNTNTLNYEIENRTDNFRFLDYKQAFDFFWNLEKKILVI